MKICFKIGGRRYCFKVPLLVAIPIKPPEPWNFPQFDLAATVLELARVVGPSELSKQLSDVCTGFIESVQKQLPKDVEIVMAQKKTAG
jgi:hypothetical protein